ncbi:MAG: M1 family peptidase, partial [bacterium]
VQYRWKTEVNNFSMPVKIQKKDNYFIIHPQVEWQTGILNSVQSRWKAATDLFYIKVEVLEL